MRTRNDMQLTKYGPGGQGILPGGNCPSELSQRPMYIIVATTVSICQRILAIRDLPFSTSSVIPLSARTTLLRTFCHSLTGYPLTYSVEYSTFVILPSLGFWILSRSPGTSVPLPERTSHLPPSTVDALFHRYGSLPFFDYGTVLLHRGEHYLAAEH